MGKRYALDLSAVVMASTIRKNKPDSNFFRFEAILKEPVDKDILQKSVDNLRHEFPFFYVNLKKNFFEYYFEEMECSYKVLSDGDFPYMHAGTMLASSCCMQILYRGKMIAAEFSHSLTDGYGGEVYICRLADEYIRLRYGVKLTQEPALYDRSLERSTENVFLEKVSGHGSLPSGERCYKIRGTARNAEHIRITTAVVDTMRLTGAAREINVTLTALIGAVMTETLLSVQNRDHKSHRKLPVSIVIPVNIRNYYDSITMKNGSYFCNLIMSGGGKPENFSKLCQEISRQLRDKSSKETLDLSINGGKAVLCSPFFVHLPLMLKIAIIRFVYDIFGGRSSSINLSNIGKCFSASDREKYVDRINFLGNAESLFPKACTMITYGSKTYINIASYLNTDYIEKDFIGRLRELGLDPVTELRK